MGRHGDAIIRTLLIDCAIFIPLEEGKDNLYQLSGIPLAELDILDLACPLLSKRVSPLGVAPTKQMGENRKPGEILLVRSRMLYAKSALNALGGIRYGLRHIHVFNRYPDPNNAKHVIQNIKYVFPRQFGLHNVFTSMVDLKETNQPFKDYTLREHEIARRTSSSASIARTAQQRKGTALPKRLRGNARSLIRKLVRNHRYCAYTQLLRHYCAIAPNGSGTVNSHKDAQSQSSLVHSAGLFTQNSAPRSTNLTSSAGSSVYRPSQQEQSIIDCATPTKHVSAFCQSVVGKLLPRDTFGVGAYGKENRHRIMSSVDRFVCMRRFESLTLHEISQGITLGCVPWLRPPGIAETSRLSQSDRTKRLEILLELIYYLFDSILIPLIRSHFYVTESSTHRNQLFYFRHDVWRKISEPSLTVVKMKTFEEIKPSSVRKLLNSRTLGFSYVRLLPKANGVRPIINLRRRVCKTSGGRSTLKNSINTELGPVHHVLNHERSQQSGRLGSALFSVGELHGRLRNFKTNLAFPGKQDLFFVKVDVQACFDTIPQDQLLALVRTLITSDRYRSVKHIEIKPSNERPDGRAQNPIRRFIGTAHPLGTFGTFSPEMANDLAQFKKRTVFTDTGYSKTWDARQLTRLLTEHVKRNIVKIGKKHFRQENGIPQGSVLSTLLCSFFYGDFEGKHLDFLQEGESLLLRLIDDFLLVTTNQSHARRFLQVMVDGSRDYGISVNTNKSLANFEVCINGPKIPRHHGSQYFPYCGMMVEMSTLEVTKDRRRKDYRLSNALTVEHSRRPGHTFHRKVLTSLKIQMHAILLDTSLNSTGQVASSLFQNFAETAMKLHSYSRSLPGNKRPSEALIIEAIRGVTRLANDMTSGTKRTKTISKYTCSITKTQMLWLAAIAFEAVLGSKQTAYPKVLHWLDNVKGSCESGMKMDYKTKSLIIEHSGKVFKGYKF